MAFTWLSGAAMLKSVCCVSGLPAKCWSEKCCPEQHAGLKQPGFLSLLDHLWCAGLHPEVILAAAEAKQQVPSLVLVNGEDLTPYRQASKRIFSVLARFGTAERLGMDEVRVLHVNAHIHFGVS